MDEDTRILFHIFYKFLWSFVEQDALKSVGNPRRLFARKTRILGEIEHGEFLRGRG